MDMREFSIRECGPVHPELVRKAMIDSLCETCSWTREVITPKGSRFFFCQLSHTDRDYPKYPPQPVVRCGGYQKKEQVGGTAQR
jgi:hypothetical protein